MQFGDKNNNFFQIEATLKKQKYISWKIHPEYRSLFENQNDILQVSNYAGVQGGPGSGPIAAVALSKGKWWRFSNSKLSDRQPSYEWLIAFEKIGLKIWSRHDRQAFSVWLTARDIFVHFKLISIESQFRTTKKRLLSLGVSLCLIKEHCVTSNN